MAAREMTESESGRAQDVKPDTDIWEAVGKGQLPEGYKNRFALLTELTKDLPPKDYPGPEPWDVRPCDEWKADEEI